MKYFGKLYASCEPTKQQIDEWLKELRKFIDTLYALSHVSKSEIQRITGIGTHTCFDTVRNFRFKTLATFFKAAEQVCEIDFDVTTLRLIIESCIMHKTNLIVREADPDEEPGENEFRILKQLSVGTDSRKGNPTGKKAEKLKQTSGSLPGYSYKSSGFSYEYSKKSPDIVCT